jgi:hypothetical protein
MRRAAFLSGFFSSIYGANLPQEGAKKEKTGQGKPTGSRCFCRSCQDFRMANDNHPAG